MLKEYTPSAPTPNVIQQQPNTKNIQHEQNKRNIILQQFLFDFTVFSWIKKG